MKFGIGILNFDENLVTSKDQKLIVEFNEKLIEEYSEKFYKYLESLGYEERMGVIGAYKASKETYVYLTQDIDINNFRVLIKNKKTGEIVYQFETNDQKYNNSNFIIEMEKYLIEEGVISENSLIWKEIFYI
jgi:hypothetical protein